jgi:hypothetical protein
MRTRDRDRRQETALREPAPAGAGTPGDGSDDVARRARGLLDAGDEVIRRALSGDSRRFLAQNRQQGGE